MSSAVSTSEEEDVPATVSQRPVRVSIGYLIQDRNHLVHLSRDAAQMSKGQHVAAEPYEYLKAGVANLSSPVVPASRFAKFDVVTNPGPIRRIFNLNISEKSMLMDAYVPSPIVERLGDGASEALMKARTSSYAAAYHFRKLDSEADRKVVDLRELFRVQVSDNELMPAHYRERTQAIAYAQAAINVHDYEPAFRPRRALELIGIHAGRATRSVSQFCGIGRGIRPLRDPGVPDHFLSRMLIEAIGFTGEANDLSAKCAKRYGLMIAQDILDHRKQ